MRTRAEGIALASVLVAIALDILFWDSFGARLSIGLVILLPSSIMLGYYIAAKDEADRSYSIGLYTLLVGIALVIAGINPKLVASAILIIIAMIIIIYLVARPPAQRPRSSRGGTSSSRQGFSQALPGSLV